MKREREPVLHVTSVCRLEQAPAALVAALCRRLTIDNPKYQDARKYGRWIGKKLKPQLFFYERQGEDGLVFPRGYAAQAMELCRETTGSLPRLVDGRRILDEVDFGFAGELRPYQRRAVDDVLRRQFGVLVAGTGSGKTVMALAVVAARRQPALVLLHNKELLYQWRDRISQFLGREAGLVGDGHFDIQPLTVGIVNTVRRRLDELVPRFGQLLVDECHRVPASLFTDAVSAFDCRYMLGLSATAYRREDGFTRLIHLFMGERVHSVDAAELEEVGAVLRPEFVQRTTDFCYPFRGDYQALLQALTGDEARNRQIVADVRAEAEGSDGIVLVVSDRVAHCQVLAAGLLAAGIDSRLLTGRLAPEERAEVVESLRRGEVKVLVATLQLVGEGFDVAGLSSLFLTTPIKFSGRLRQVIGRIMRPADGKKPRVIDYNDFQVGVLRRSALAREQLYRS